MFISLCSVILWMSRRSDIYNSMVFEVLPVSQSIQQYRGERPFRAFERVLYSSCDMICLLIVCLFICPFRNCMKRLRSVEVGVWIPCLSDRENIFSTRIKHCPVTATCTSFLCSMYDSQTHCFMYVSYYHYIECPDYNFYVKCLSAEIQSAAETSEATCDGRRATGTNVVW